MRTLKLSVALILTLAMFTMTFTSCKKEKKETLSSLEGTWTIQSVLTNGAVDDRTFDGTWMFSSCKLRDSKKNNCNGMYNYTLTYMGVVEEYTDSFKFSLEEEDIIIIGDARYRVVVSSNSLTLTVIEDDQDVVISFTK